MDCLKPVTFPWHNLCCYMPSLGGRGVVPLLSPTPHCSTGDRFPVLLILGFLTEEEERGRGRSGKGRLGRKPFCFL